MGIARAILSVAALFGTLTNAWNEDSRCYRRRASDPKETDQNLVIEKSDQVASPEKGLFRGSEDERQLQQWTFMLKMYWEEGYCWQEEWRERKWCLKCEGSNCNEDDYLLLDECSWNDNEQWFVYESINADENWIKLKPWTNPDLCFTRSGVNAHTLKPCGDDYLDSSGRDAQILIGFRENGEFELHPNGRSGDCLVNEHREYRSQLLVIEIFGDVDKVLTRPTLLFFQQTPNGMRSSGPKTAKQHATTEQVNGKFTLQRGTMHIKEIMTTMLLTFE
jgi:hypothetical protein